ncbi:MAG: TetR/AcrR family transcriptional regulator [Anaerolineaceae bacterium]
MQNRGIETRTNIMNAAVHQFALNGFNRASIADLQEANVSKGAFYHHFPSKQNLFIELLNNWLDKIDAQLIEIENESADLASFQSKISKISVEVFDDAAGMLTMFLEFWIHATRDPVLWEATIKPYVKYRNFFAKLLERIIQEEIIRDIGPELGATVFVSLAVGLLLQNTLDPNASSWSQTTLNSINLLLHGILRSE